MSTKMTPLSVITETYEAAGMSGDGRAKLKVDICDSILDGLSLLCADWAGEIRNSTFKGCDLRGSRFGSAKLRNVRFEACHLAGTDVSPDRDNVDLIDCQWDRVWHSPDDRR